MEQKHREEYLKKLLLEGTPYSAKDISYKASTKTMKVYEINIDYLVYNPYNGRIASLVKSFERQRGNQLNPESTEDMQFIEKFLWESNSTSNEKTLKDLKDKQQLEPGIVTLDGVIIDGNRRAFLLKKLGVKFFKAIILPDELNSEPQEIMKLETTYQMGEDAKVDYNAIEKYLKCKDLINFFKPKEIADMMGESESQIKEYLGIMSLMEDYLESLGCAGIYTALDKTEGAFVDICKYFKAYSKSVTAKSDWEYDDSDVNDLKLIYFDYITFIYNKSKSRNDDEDTILGGSKDYRFIGQPNKKTGIFCNGKVWDKFSTDHFREIDPIRQKYTDGEYSIDSLREANPTQSLEQIIKGRNEQWAKETGSFLKRNLGEGKYSLENKNLQNQPEELLQRALTILENIDPEKEGFAARKNVHEIVSQINKIMWIFKKKCEKWKGEVV